MPTIVTYTDTAPPRNQFQHHIISPTHSSPCCFSAMDALGRVCREERYVYEYRRCRTCGFTVRVIVRYPPDHTLMASLRKEFATTLTRKIPPGCAMPSLNRILLLGSPTRPRSVRRPATRRFARSIFRWTWLTTRMRASSGWPSIECLAFQLAVVGSITDRTSETRLAGNPPCRACSRTVSSSGAMYTQ